MEKTLGKEYKNARDREAFLKDNCDKVEEKGYMKPYTPEELQGHKENLANVSIEIAEIEAEKKAQDAYYKGQLKPLNEQRSQMVSNIKSKSQYVKEICYKFVDRKSNDRVTAEIITDKLRDLDVNDPCKYDFALFGVGEYQKHVKL